MKYFAFPDLQFELHLRHVTSNIEEKIADKLGSSKEEIAKYKATIASMEAEINEFEDYRQQQKWKEIQLQQRVRFLPTTLWLLNNRFLIILPEISKCSQFITCHFEL